MIDQIGTVPESRPDRNLLVECQIRTVSEERSDTKCVR